MKKIIIAITSVFALGFTYALIESRAAMTQADTLFVVTQTSTGNIEAEGKIKGKDIEGLMISGSSLTISGKSTLPEVVTAQIRSASGGSKFMLYPSSAVFTGDVKIATMSFAGFLDTDGGWVPVAPTVKTITQYDFPRENTLKGTTNYFYVRFDSESGGSITWSWQKNDEGWQAGGFNVGYNSVFDIPPQIAVNFSDTGYSNGDVWLIGYPQGPSVISGGLKVTGNIIATGIQTDSLAVSGVTFAGGYELVTQNCEMAAQCTAFCPEGKKALGGSCGGDAYSWILADGPARYECYYSGNPPSSQAVVSCVIIGN